MLTKYGYNINNHKLRSVPDEKKISYLLFISYNYFNPAFFCQAVEAGHRAGVLPVQNNPGQISEPASSPTAVPAAVFTQVVTATPAATAVPGVTPAGNVPATPVETVISTPDDEETTVPVSTPTPSVSPVLTPPVEPIINIQGCSIFPSDNVWNVPVDTLPVDVNSNAYVNTIGVNRYVHADFGSGTWNGGPIGIPYNIVTGNQPKVNVSFDYAGESDIGPYPIPSAPLIEGGTDATGDRHVLLVDKDNCILYELYYLQQSGGSWHAGSGAVFDLKSNNLRTDGWTFG